MPKIYKIYQHRYCYYRIQPPRDPANDRYRQDDTFHLLERVDPAELKSGDEASYHQFCFDRLQRYQVIKQADTLLLMTRLPEQFAEEEKLAAWEDFEPLCIHDSTLSFASHALFAAQNGRKRPPIPTGGRRSIWIWRRSWVTQARKDST